MKFFHSFKNYLRKFKWCISNFALMPLIINWEERAWNGPAPLFVKHAILRQCPCRFWIETGTYHGETSEMLSNFAKNVITIEPEKKLFENAKIKFDGSNVKVLYGESEKKLESAIQTFLSKSQNEIAFFLDGHFSGAGTHLGNTASPIVQELEIIEKYLSEMNTCYVYIDDFREFSDSYSSQFLFESTYPSKSFLVNFANRNRLNWEVKQDIFIMFQKSHFNDSK